MPSWRPAPCTLRSATRMCRYWRLRATDGGVLGRIVSADTRARPRTIHAPAKRPISELIPTVSAVPSAIPPKTSTSGRTGAATHTAALPNHRRTRAPVTPTARAKSAGAITCRARSDRFPVCLSGGSSPTWKQVRRWNGGTRRYEYRHASLSDGTCHEPNMRIVNPVCRGAGGLVDRTGLGHTVW